MEDGSSGFPTFGGARQAAELLGEGATVEKVDDIDTFFRLGVTRTPALAIDEQVISSGKVLSADEIVALIRNGDS
jgi:hypothetical protein